MFFFIYIPLQLKRVVSELYTVDKARSNDDFFPTPPFSVASYLCLFQLRHCVYWFCSLFSSALLFLIAFFSSAIARFIFSLWSLLPRFFVCVVVFVLCPWNAFNSVLKIYHSSRQSATSPSSPTYFLLRFERHPLRPVIGIENVSHPVSH